MEGYISQGCAATATSTVDDTRRNNTSGRHSYMKAYRDFWSITRSPTSTVVELGCMSRRTRPKVTHPSNHFWPVTAVTLPCAAGGDYPVRFMHRRTPYKNDRDLNVVIHRLRKSTVRRP